MNTKKEPAIPKKIDPAKLVQRLGAGVVISPVIFILAISLINATLYNRPLFFYAIQNLDHWSLNSAQTLFTVFIIISTITASVLFIIHALLPALTRPVSALLFIGNAFALYFMSEYSVILDRTMMGNVINTDPTELAEMLTTNLILFVVFLGMLPALLLTKTAIKKTRRTKSLACAVASICVCVGCTFILSNTWLWLDKNAKTLGGLVLPWSYIVNTVRFVSTNNRGKTIQELLPVAYHTDDSKTVVILVIGETARSKNFSLYGYSRNTNPYLSQQGVVPLKTPTSCATYTTGSVQCILSHRADSTLFSRQYEPLPSYLHRHDVDVIWRTNNWGEPPIKANEYKTAGTLATSCKGSGCQHDEVLLTGLEERIRALTKQKALIVLHQKGSHGPAYNTRYPDSFEIFKPVCKSVELSHCSDEELVNAYDNTILYTDYFLFRVIEILKKLGNIATMMMYLSDHGESLGESGIYLHGMPYAIAPRVQKEIPFIIWMSDSFKLFKGVSNEQLTSRTDNSQSNVFHSILGALQINSEIYDKNRDIFHFD